ncbi:hypothetical protein ACHWQZ_G011184 [Mnemiopsis leidyi]
MMFPVQTLSKVISEQSQGKDIEHQLQSRGLLHLDSNGNTFCTTITAAPTPVNLNDYEAVERLQPELNLILDRLSKDKEIILRELSPIAEHDPLAKGLLEIYRELPESHKDKIILSLNRHDYMYAAPDHTDKNAFLHGQFKLVEYNCIAASLAALTEEVYFYHRTLLNKLNVETSQFNHKVNNVRGFSEGLKTGYQLYNDRYKCNGTCVLILVETDPHGFNYFDQQLLLNCLEKQGVPTLRYSAQQLVDRGRVVDGRYYVDDKEVAVIYFRSMYDPVHFKSRDFWTARRDMEFSAAVTVPSVRHQIVNMKLFQMLLSRRSFLQKYTSSPELTEEVLSLFCETLPLNLDEEGDRNAQLGIDHPAEYVLKPQREGGGNNMWDQEMKQKLISLKGNPARAQFILMKKIRPPIRKNKFVKRGVITEELDTVSEFGYYSVYCTNVSDNEDKVISNRVVGPLVRTKSATENEGGVAVGISAIDSPFFVLPSQSD